MNTDDTDLARWEDDGGYVYPTSMQDDYDSGDRVRVARKALTPT